MAESEDVKALVSRQLELVAQPEHRAALSALLLATPHLEERDWDYGAVGERFPFWVVAKSTERGIILVYSEQGFGPETPWGFLLIDDPHSDSLGMDSQWNTSLGGVFAAAGLDR